MSPLEPTGGNYIYFVEPSVNLPLIMSMTVIPNHNIIINIKYVNISFFVCFFIDI